MKYVGYQGLGPTCPPDAVSRSLPPHLAPIPHGEHPGSLTWLPGGAQSLCSPGAHAHSLV